MYDQDQFAWNATDMMRAERGEGWMQTQGGRGWIVDPLPDRNVVRFVHNGASGPELFYDVTFPASGAAQSSLPPSPTLSPDELAQYKARMLALGGVKQPCSNRYNTVALKDPAGAGWLVWAMAATTDPNLMIIGGHYRFTISADGSIIRQADALSRSCIRFDKSRGANSVDQLMSHIVSTTPVETHIFASLAYRTTFYVGTPDGKTWLVDGAHVSTVDMDSPGAGGFSARTLASFDEHCRAILKVDGPDGKPQFTIGQTEIGIIAATEKEGPLKLSIPGTISAIMCNRKDIVPAPNDYKVLLAGYPLFVGTNSADGTTRMGTLESVDGRLQFTWKQGTPMTAEEETRLQARINTMQGAFQAKH